MDSCPNKDAPTVDTLPTTVAPTDPQVVKFKGVHKFWCTNCKRANTTGRWTVSHTTSQHKAGKPRNPAPTNSASTNAEANTIEDASGIELGWAGAQF